MTFLDLKSSLSPVRHALLTALGLAALACGPKEGNTAGEESGSGESSGATGSSGVTDSGATTEVTTGTMQGCAGEVTQIMQAHTMAPTASGFESCDGGIAHRVEAVKCEVPTAPADCAEGSTGCASNADCTEKPFGSCQQDIAFGGLLEGGTCSCRYGCESDADCGAGEICRCAGEGLGPTSACIRADCTVDADCGEGLCSVNIGQCSDAVYSAHCTTPNDTCKSDADCGTEPCSFIDYQEPKAWGCDLTVCGRPYLVDEVAVLADAAARDDWRGGPAPDLSLETRGRLAAAWTELARMEHGSVAAFAGFVLQLLAVGAPAELVSGAQQALGDEVEHARLCFGLASAYAGRGVGPGPLAVAPTAAVDLAGLLVAVIREACVCETLSALEAREAAQQAVDPAVRGVWLQISGDEQRHAELGWRVVQWVLAAAPELGALARDTFAAAIREARRGAAREAAAPAELELRAHGIVDAPLRAAVWRRGLAELIGPCAAALCAVPLAA